MAVELATGYVSIVPSTRGLGRSLSSSLTPGMTSAGRDAGDNASRSFGSRFTANMGQIAKRAGVALGAAFVGAGTYGVKVAADFQQTRIAFEGILGGADEANKRLTELQQFAAKTPFEFTGLADAAKNLLAVGFSADDIIPTMTTLGNVAATLGVGENEIKGVVRALGQMKGKGKASAEELQQISEQIPGFSAVQAIADDMGISVAEAFDEMQAGAIPADKAITAILRGMEKFPGAAGAMERQSKTLNGVLSTFKDTIDLALIQGIEPFLPAISSAFTSATPIIGRFISGTIDGIASVITGFVDLKNGVSDLIDELSRGDIGAGIAVELGTLVGLAEDSPLVDGLATALSAVGDAMEKVVGALQGATGVASDAFAGVIGTTADAWDRYAHDGVGPVADAFDAIQGTIGGVNDALAEQRDILIPLASAAAGFAAAYIAYQQASGVITLVSSSLELLGPALSGALAPLLANPVGLIIAAVVAIGAAFVAAYLNIKPFRKAVDGVVDVVVAFAQTAGAAIQDFADKALPVLKDFAGEVADFARAVGRAFATGFRAVAGFIDRNLVRPLRPLGRFLTDEVVPAFAAFGDLVTAVFQRISDVVGPASTVVSAVLTGLAKVIGDAVGPALAVLGAGFSAAFGVIETVVKSIVNVLAPVLATAFDGVVSAVDIAWGVITGIIQAALDTITGFLDILTGLVSGDFSKVWSGIGEVIGAPLTALQEIIENTFGEIGEFLSGVPGRIDEFVGAMFSGASDTLGSVLDGIVTVVTTAWDGLVEFASKLPGRMVEAVVGMWDGIAEGFENVINFVIGAWNSLEFKVGGVHKGPIQVDGFTLGVPDMDPVDFANGGIVTARPGGLISRLGEAGRDEAVIPLPSGFDISDLNTGAAPLIGSLTVQQPPGEDSGTTVRREIERHRMLQMAVASR